MSLDGSDGNTSDCNATTAVPGGGWCASRDAIELCSRAGSWGCARPPDNGSRVSCEVHARFHQSRGVRFPSATHSVLRLSRKEASRRVLAVLPKRFSKYRLSLNPEKTRLIEFHPSHVRGPSGPSRPLRPRAFDLLGFTSFWTKSRRSVSGDQAESSHRSSESDGQGRRSVAA
jgi:hypothetical protein